MRSRSVLGLVFLTVFLDMVGFSVIFPLFPRMLEHYLALEGDSSAIGKLLAFLAKLIGGGTDPASRFAVTVLFGGLLGSLYSFLQFVASPMWGALSDRIGRRPTLLFTLAGTAASYVLWFFAGTFPLLVLARALGGVMAGNISTASAAIADIFEGKDRVRGMGVMGAGIGLGFVVGPAIGAISSGFDVTAHWPGLARFGIHPFSGPALFAFLLAAVNLGWAMARFPETLSREVRGTRSSERTLHPFRMLRSIDMPGVRDTVTAQFAYFAAFGAMEFTLTFLTHERFQYGERDQAVMLSYVGIAIALVRGGLVRRLTARLGERKLAFTGISLTLPGFVLVGLAGGGGTLYAGLTLLAIGSAFVMPCLSSLVSRYTPSDRQGLALGVFSSAGALARAVGPIGGGVLYWSLGSRAPYLLGAGLLVLPLYLARRLPAPPA
jgi:MFS family permease